MHIDTEKIKGLFDNEAMTFVHSTYHKLMYDYIPFDTGTLADSVDITPEYVHFKQPYAKKQYTGDNFNFSKEKHPLACARWDKQALTARREQFEKSIQNHMKKKVENG